MITNTHRGDFYAVPHHRLKSEAHTIIWIRGMHGLKNGGGGRMVLAETLHRMYPEGCAVCSDTCRVMSLINPSGGIRDLPQPWPEHPIHDMVNNPKAKVGSKEECPCMGFIDPEVGGPWRERGLDIHHPFCMYSRGSLKRYMHFVKLKKAAERPDAWIRSLRECGR